MGFITFDMYGKNKKQFQDHYQVNDNSLHSIFEVDLHCPNGTQTIVCFPSALAVTERD